MNKQYKTIFFDWHKTLSHCDFWVQLKDPLHDRHHWHENIINYLFGENKELIQEWMRGKVDEGSILEKVSEKFSYPIKPLRDDLAESCRAMTFLSDEILPLIAQLRQRGIRCVVATDNMDVFRRYVVPALELDKHFDDVLVSFDQRHLKFDVPESGEAPTFFRSYLEKYDLQYSEVLLIDDRVDTSGTFEKLGFDMFEVQDTAALLGHVRALIRG